MPPAPEAEALDSHQPAGLCALCAEPCPANTRFCCLGCGNVYSILIESGAIREGEDPRETDLFKRSLELGLISTRSREARQSSTIPENAVVEEKLFHVDGMWCSACGWLIEHTLSKETAVREAEVFFTSDLLRVRYCPQYLPSGRIESAVKRLGYQITPHDGEARDNSVERRRELLRLGFAAFLWLNVMSLNLSVYFGAGLQHALPIVVMALATPVVFYAGFPLLRIGWIGILRGAPRMESLLAIGIVAAYGYSTVTVIRGGNHVYFDIACAIVTLVLLGKYVERSARDSTARAITGLYQMLPAKARVLRDGRERFVAIKELAAGDVFLVKAGERVPADGVVTTGESWVDESVLTGESRPVLRQPGDRITGGSLSTSGVLEVSSTAVGEDSALARIVRSVEAALSKRSPIERTADRVARIFVPAVILLAIATGLITAFTGLAAGDALMRAVTVLVIACPCALGIATPLAITAAVGAASKRGILISDPGSLEAVQRADTCLLDKTGTVTEGRFELLEANPVHLARIAAIERYSEHPLGRAVVERTTEIPLAENIEILKGRGIRGDVEGTQVFCGNRTLLAEASLRATPELEARAAEAEALGHTVAFYGWQGAVEGILIFGDRIREDAPAFVSGMRANGVKVMLVSGDSTATVRAVASAVGADEWYAEVLPEAKQEIVKKLQTRGLRVVMVGDGVNDGPALAQADLGIAMGSGTDLAMKASTVVLMSNRLSGISDVFTLAKRTLRTVKQNLFWAFAYNVAGISFAVTGLLNPVLGAGAMVISSLFVAWNSSRLTRW